MQATISPPPVVVLDSPRSKSYAYELDVVGGARVSIGGPVGVLTAVVGLSLLEGRSLSMPLWIGLTVYLAIFSLVSASMVYARLGDWKADRAAHRADAATANTSDPKWVVKSTLLENGGLCGLDWLTGRARPGSVGRFQSALQEAGLPRALVIVQPDVMAALDDIPLDATFVEPERVLGAMSRRSGAFWFQAVLAVYFTWLLTNAALQGKWVMAGLFLLGMVTLGMELLKTFGVHLTQANAPVMGMGVYSDDKGRRWTVQDSTVYLYPSRAGVGKGAVAELIGPDGHCTRVFHGPGDPALKMFWQRWMHPHPRPELV